jgi:hypothetical protein
MSVGDAVFAWVRAGVAEGARGVAAGLSRVCPAAMPSASSACGRHAHALAVASALPPRPAKERFPARRREACASGPSLPHGPGPLRSE